MKTTNKPKIEIREILNFIKSKVQENGWQLGCFGEKKLMKCQYIEELSLLIDKRYVVNGNDASELIWALNLLEANGIPSYQLLINYSENPFALVASLVHCCKDEKLISYLFPIIEKRGLSSFIEEIKKNLQYFVLDIFEASVCEPKISEMYYRLFVPYSQKFSDFIQNIKCATFASYDMKLGFATNFLFDKDGVFRYFSQKGEPIINGNKVLPKKYSYIQRIPIAIINPSEKHTMSTIHATYSDVYNLLSYDKGSFEILINMGYKPIKTYKTLSDCLQDASDLAEKFYENVFILKHR